MTTLSHDEDAHYLLAPSDLAHHIPEHHHTELADIDTRVDVESWLVKHGIPSTDPAEYDNDPDAARNVDLQEMWHDLAHAAAEGELDCDDCRKYAQFFFSEESQ